MRFDLVDDQFHFSALVGEFHLAKLAWAIIHPVLHLLTSFSGSEQYYHLVSLHNGCGLG